MSVLEKMYAGALDKMDECNKHFTKINQIAITQINQKAQGQYNSS